MEIPKCIVEISEMLSVHMTNKLDLTRDNEGNVAFGSEINRFSSVFIVILCRLMDLWSFFSLI